MHEFGHCLIWELMQKPCNYVFYWKSACPIMTISPRTNSIYYAISKYMGGLFAAGMLLLIYLLFKKKFELPKFAFYKAFHFGFMGGHFFQGILEGIHLPLYRSIGDTLTIVVFLFCYFLILSKSLKKSVNEI